MSDKVLLTIIYEESLKDPSGEALGATVEKRYGPNFDQAFRRLLQAGHIDSRQVNHIGLSIAGRRAIGRV